MIVKYCFPISDYYGDGIFYKNLYIECDDVSPSLERIKEILTLEHEKEVAMSIDYPEYGPYCFEYKQCLESLQYMIDCSEFPVVNKSKVGNSIVIIHPKFGLCHISADVITLHKAS